MSNLDPLDSINRSFDAWPDISWQKASRTLHPIVLLNFAFALAIPIFIGYVIVEEGLKEPGIITAIGLFGIFFAVITYDSSQEEGEVQNGVIMSGGRVFKKKVPTASVHSWRVIKRNIANIYTVKYLCLFDRHGELLIEIPKTNPMYRALLDYVEVHLTPEEKASAEQYNARKRALENLAIREGRDKIPFDQIKKIVLWAGLISLGASAGTMTAADLSFESITIPPILIQAMIIVNLTAILGWMSPFVFFELPFGPFEQATSNALMALLSGSILNYATAFSVGSFLDPWPLARLGLIAGGLLAIPLSAKARLATRPQARWFQVVFFLTFFIPIPFLVNRHFDHFPPRKTTIIVREMTLYKTYHFLETFMIRFNNPLRPGSVSSISVSKEMFKKLKAGDELTVQIYPGALGAPWISDLQ